MPHYPVSDAPDLYGSRQTGAGGSRATSSSSSFILVVLVILAAAGGLLLWQSSGTMSGGVIERVLGVQTKQPPPVYTSEQPGRDGPDKKGEKGSSSKGRKLSRVAGEEALAPVGPGATPRPDSVSPPSSLFPTAADIPIGSERAMLLATFGQPSLKTTKMERDGLVEAFVYLHRNRNTATFALLRDGRVVSVNTSTY